MEMEKSLKTHTELLNEIETLKKASITIYNISGFDLTPKKIKNLCLAFLF